MNIFSILSFNVRTIIIPGFSLNFIMTKMRRILTNKPVVLPGIA